MAGDWLKMRHDLADDPAVIRLGCACRLDEDAVIGKLFRLWSWADRHTQAGHADGVGLDWVDRTVRCPGFAAEMVRVGWLEETGSGLAFPRFDRHCSDTAKARALTGNRVKRHRNAPSVTDALPEKRREEVPPPPRARARAEPDQAAWATLRDAWKAGPGQPWTPPDPPDGAVERLSEPGWLDAAVQAIGRLRACRYFDARPVDLHQFCSPRFVHRVNQGRYDSPKQPPAQVRPAVAGDRPSAEQAAAEWQRAASDPERARRQAEYLAAKQRKAAKPPERAGRPAATATVDDDIEALRAETLRKLMEAS